MIAGRVASSVVQRQVKYVVPVPAAEATGLVARVYAQIEEEMRIVIPPALLHSPSPDVLAAYWVLMREPMAHAATDRTTKEAVAAAVSVANICPYCAEMHTVGMYDLSTEHNAEAIAADRVEEITEPALRAVTAWARTAHLADPEAPGLPRHLDPAQRDELLGVVVAFHYVARMVNVFLSNFLLPPGLGPRSRRRLKQGISRVLRPTLRNPREPGRAVPLLPAPDADGALPAGAPLGAAFARAYAVLEEAGRRSMSPDARRVVTDRVDDWDGGETGMSTAWVEDLVGGLPEADAAAARLALLTALASYQVDDTVVQEFQRHHPRQSTLVDVASWASYVASARIGQRQSAAFPTFAN